MHVKVGLERTIAYFREELREVRRPPLSVESVYTVRPSVAHGWAVASLERNDGAERRDRSDRPGTVCCSCKKAARLSVVCTNDVVCRCGEAHGLVP